MKKRVDRINNFRFPISQPTVFDEEELTVLRLVSKVAYKINETVGEVNNWIDYLDVFVDAFDENLQDKVIKTLTDWQDSGLLDDIINELLQPRMDILEDEINAKLELFDTFLVDYASLFTNNPDAKNSIYRGRYLGSSVTAAQYTSISSGTFTDLYIGDYWTIGGVNWRIAAFNYYRNTGDSLVPGNHITITPDTQLYTHVMNDTNITTDGYVGSKMYIEGLEQAKATIRGIFGAHLVKHRQILSNTTVDGKTSGWAWIDSEVELMSEPMVYGSIIWGESANGGSGYNIGVGKSQLPLFRLNPRMINTRQSYWLRDVVSAANFAAAGNYGTASNYLASIVVGVRPTFSIS